MTDTKTLPSCDTCGAEAEELCGKGCPSEATRGSGALSKAIASLGAVEVAPGRYAVRPDLLGDRWRFTSEQALRVLGSALTLATRDERSITSALWREHSGNLVYAPSWWSPEQRFAWKLTHGSSDVDNRRFESEGEAYHGMHSYTTTYARGISVERITADLESGEEIPC